VSNFGRVPSGSSQEFTKMPLSLWGLDEARKNFNKRVDDTGSAAWSAARGRRQKDEDPDPNGTPCRTSTSTSSNTSSSTKRDPLPPPRKLSPQDLPPPPKTLSGNQYAEAKTRQPPPPPPTGPSRQPSLPAAAPALPRRSTSAVVPSVEDTIVRPSEVLNRAPTYPVSIQRTQTQDGVTNELAEKLARMRTRSQSPGNPLDRNTGLPPLPAVSPSRLSPHTTGTSKLKPTVSPKSISPVSTGTPTKPISPNLPSTSTMNPPQYPVSTKSPAPVTATKPGLPPRTTPAPPRIAPLKSAHSLPQPTPLPYTPSQLHKSVLPKFIYPTPDASCNSAGLSTFNRLFPQPLWELELASLFILETLYPSDDTYTFTPKHLDGAVSLVMRDMDGNAHAENSTVIISSGGRKEFKWRSDLVFSTRNLTNLANRNAGDTWFIEEVRGVIVHELTHSWQWSCHNVPGGLIEGLSPVPISQLQFT